MNNKKFLLISIAVVAIVFAGLAIFTKNKEEPKDSKPRISNDLLIKFHSPVKGAADAPVTIVEFLDPECEACRAMHPIIKRLLSEYEGKVRLVIRYMPLHKNSMYAATVLEEARERGVFDRALDIMFETQPIWGSHHAPRPDLIPGYLEPLGIPSDAFDAEKLLAKHGSKIEIDFKDGQAVGANRTPTFFVNGIMLEQIGYEPIRRAIDEELK